MRHVPSFSSDRPGFTLIELLVVVSIIVVLLAMLTPAIDRAMYQAELAVCETRLHAVATGVDTYAMGSRRAYPYRAVMDSSITWLPDGIGAPADVPGVTAPRKRWPWPNVVVSDGYGPEGQGDHNFYDDRPILAPYLGGLGLKSLHDPLTGGTVDFSVPGTSVFTDYQLWFGARFTGPGGGKGLYRLGDRLEYTSGGETHSFTVVASDQDVMLPPGGVQKLWTSHPDADGAEYFLQSIAPPDWVLARWERTTDEKRGPLDNNFAYADGSAERYVGVTWDEALDPKKGRMTKVPMPIDGVTPDIYWNQLPSNNR